MEGFAYKSYSAELVGEILNRYLADTSLERLAMQLEGVSFASAQRIVNHAIEMGVLSPQDKHKQGGGFAIKRARLALAKHPQAKATEIAHIAECGEATVYRAMRNK